MKIIQVVPLLFYGDAIGNCALALKAAIKSLGYKTGICAGYIDPRFSIGTAGPVGGLRVKSDDVLIYHFGIGSDLCYSIAQLKCRKIIYYHNITPPLFLRGYSKSSFDDAVNGLEALTALADSFDYALAVSEFNRQGLISMGYKIRIDVLPVLLFFDDYKTTPGKGVMAEYSDGKANILFTGRLVPSKKQEDIIKTFYYYKKYINPASRLIFVGAGIGERYHQRLVQYIKKLDLTDVIFTGHIKFSELLAYYKTAAVFLSMSEHEGFGVPLLEAMYFGVPIIAYAAAAIPETLGDSGILLEEKDHRLAAEVIDELVNNPEFRNQIIEKQNRRLQDFSYESVLSRFAGLLKGFLNEEKNDKWPIRK